jgi:uncharacterized protein YbaR (Trm112 family)
MNQPVLICPHCKNDDRSMIDLVELHRVYFCTVCAKIFEVPDERLPQRTTDRTD